MSYQPRKLSAAQKRWPSAPRPKSEWAEQRKDFFDDEEQYKYASHMGNPHGNDDELWNRDKETAYQKSKLDKLPDFPDAVEPTTQAEPAQSEPAGPIEYSPEIQEAKERVNNYQRSTESADIYTAPGQTRTTYINRSESDPDKYKFTPKG